MNIPYLLKKLDTTELSELAANIDLPILDMNLAIWDSIDKGEISVDEEKNEVKLLVEPTPSFDDDLKSKLLRVVQHYAKNGSNVTRGRLTTYIKDPVTNQGYGWHEYITTLEFMIDNGEIVQEVIDVPGVKKKRPPHKFAFLCLPENNENGVNEEMNAKAVSKWIDDFALQTKKR